MKKSLKFGALVLAVLLSISMFSFVALAEPDENGTIPRVGATDDEQKESYVVSFTVKGSGVVKVYSRTDELLATITGGSTAVKQDLTIDSSIYFVINGTILGVQWNEPNRVIDDDGYYWIRPSRNSYVNITFKDGAGIPDEPDNGNENDTPKEENHSVKVTVGAGGSVMVNERTIGGNSGTNVLIKKGEKAVITVTPNEGYEVDAFKVDGLPVELTENTYTIEAVDKDVSIMVTFKNPLDVQNAIGVADVDWNNPVIDIANGKTVLREVFAEIAKLSLQENKFVEFRSSKGSIFIPYGGQTVGTSESVNMEITEVSADTLASISAAFEGTGVNFKAYSFSALGNTFPVGTKVSFNLGAGFAEKELYLFVYDGASVTLRDENLDPIAADSNGVSGLYTYSNEAIIVLADGIPTKLSVEMITNEGGSINGESDIVSGETYTYVVRANEGYYIKQILINDEAFSLAENTTVQNIVLESVDKSYSIKVEFAANEVVDDQGDDKDGNNVGTIIVILVIVLIAVCGAAALFIVKWRQEKF